MARRSYIKEKIELEVGHSFKQLDVIRESERRGMELVAPAVAAEYMRRAPRGPTGNYIAGADVEVTQTGKPEILIENSAPHAYPVECGTAERITADGAARGSMPKMAPMRKTAQAMKREVFAAVKRELKRG